RLIEIGSHEELLKQNGKYAEMFRVQSENYREDARSLCKKLAHKTVGRLLFGFASKAAGGLPFHLSYASKRAGCTINFTKSSHGGVMQG
ncbi:MAG: hypothetical protein IIX85_07815, partial [Clostridia bacterium]|nr:hypothetical protein [Clostridia bacterium]